VGKPNACACKGAAGPLRRSLEETSPSRATDRRVTTLRDGPGRPLARQREPRREDLTAAGVDQFLCWRRAAGYVSSLSLNKMSPLLHYLQGTGVVPTFEPITPMTPVGLLIERYRCYLAEERSLSAPSIRNYTGVARDFLSSLSMNSELDLESMTTARVTEFVLSECRRQKVASAKAMTTRLRSLLRFLYVVV